MKTTRTKKILSILLAVIMVVGMIPATAIPAYAADEASCPIEGATGTGTESDPVIVDTYEELKAAMLLDDEIFVLVEQGTYIEIPENIKSRDNKKLKVLTVNGTLSGEYSLMRFRSPTIIQGNGKIHCSNSYCIGVGVGEEITIKGNITFESGSVDVDSAYIIGVSETGTLVIEGGTFMSTAGYPTYFCTDDTTAGDIKGKVYFKGGYFPHGIHGSSIKYYLPDGYLYGYDDGTISSRLIDGKPVAIIEGYTLGFESQTPSMPEGKTITHLGNFEVGSADAKITFSFKANPMSDVLLKGGLSVTEYMKVVSSKRGVIKEQNSGAAYTIDNTVADSYTITEIITYIDNGKVFDTIKHSFTLTINPQGYVQDPDCPVEGATGTGTEEDPIIVDTYEELKAAMWLDDEIFVLVEEGTYIEIPENIKSRDNEKLKVLTVNGTLSGEYSLLRFRSPTIIQGNGKIHCSNSYCIGVGIGEEITIKGNITFESGSVDVDSAYIIGVSETGTLVIEGGTFMSTAGFPTYFCTDDTTAGDIKGKVYFKGGYFPQGIHGSSIKYYLPDGYLYGYDDGTISSQLIYEKPVTVFSFGFENQSPAMPEGETETDLGVKYIGAAGAVTFSFSAKSLPQASIDAGCKVKEDLKIYDPTGKLIKSQASGASCQVVPEIEGIYIIIETLTLTDSDGNEITSLTHTFTFTAENTYSISARISGVPEGKAMTINLYKAGEDTPFKTTTAYGQGDFDINNLPLDVAFEIESVPKGDYILEAKCNNYVTYRCSFTMKDKSFTDLIFMETYKIVVVDITGMFEEDTATVKLYKTGTDKVAHTAKIKGNGSHIFAEVEKGSYTVEVSAAGYKTQTKTVTASDEIASAYFDMKLDPTKVDFGFGTQTPSVTDYEKENGITNMGLVFEAPSFSFTAAQLNYKYLDMGYSVTTDIDVWLSDSVVGGGDTNHSWACPSGSYGTKRVVEKVILLDPDGKEIATKSHTYTFTYLPLKFNTQKPSVTTDEAAAGVTNLGTLTTAPTFSFSAVPIDSAALINEGYSIKVKTEAYQGDILVYSAENGDPYIHAYQYQGKVVQTIELYKNDELIGTKSHTYNFNMEFPEGTLTLGNDFLSIEEGATQRITAVVMPEDLANVLRWSSSNEDIVTVDNNGNVTALQAGSAIITASLPDGTSAYCPVLVTASDVLVYVGGVGLREGEYLAERSSIPTTATRPADNYAYLSTVDGKLTLTLNNYNYEGTGTFISNRLTYGIYSSADLKIVAYGDNNIGPITAPLERYTSYGIGEGETISINSDEYSTLTIKGVNTGIDLARYLFINGNLNMTDVAVGVSGGNTMGRVALESGKINIDCTGTAFNLIGGELAFDGAQVKLNCNSGIRFVRTGNLWINAGRLNIFAETSGIQIKSGDGFRMDNGIVLIDAEYNAIEAEDTLTINGGYMLLRSFNTASDSTYSAVNGSGTVTLGTGITGKGALTSAGSSSLTNYSESYKKHFDYLVFSESGINSFLKQPESGSVEKGETLTVSWELTFTPVKLVLRTYSGGTNTYTELDVKTTSLELPILPDGGYYQIQAYFASSSYKPSDKIYVTEVTTTLKGNISSYLGDSEFITLTLYDENMDIPYYQYTLPGSTTSYSFPDVPYGEYVLVAEKPGHIPYQCNVTAEADSLYQDIELQLYADTNLDGEIDALDYQALINAVLSDDHEQIETEEYDDLIHYDLVMDGYLDVLDAALMALVVNGFKTIDEVYDLQKGDYDYDGEAYTESDINSMYEMLSDIEVNAPKLSTSQKFAADLNYNGRVDEEDLVILKNKFSYLV